MIDPGVITGFVGMVGKSSLLNTLRDEAVDFLADRAKGIAGDEIAGRVEALRSDAKLKGQIQKRLERAAQRWAEDSPDDELVAAVAKSTTFFDLPSVQQAVREIAGNPFSNTTAQTVQGAFRDVLPARFEEERIVRGVGEFAGILREEFVSIPALQPAIQTFASLTTANAAAVLPHMQELLEQLLKGPTATEETLGHYLTWVIDGHRYLDPKGTMQTTRQVQVLLDEVYVSLEAEVEEPLRGIDRRLYEEEIKSLEEREDLKPEEREDYLENLQARLIREEVRNVSSQPVELAELVRKHESLVILGDPGAGKTTLLRYLALRHAQARRQSNPATEEFGEVFLPVYLRIAEYAERGHGQALEDFLIANLRGREHRDRSLPDLIQASLDRGECIVLLDGLDEVIEPSQRALISDQINSLIHNLGANGNRFVITSRVAGYRSAPLDGRVPHYRVRDMNPEQIRRFIEQWCHAVERFQTPALAPEAQGQNAQKEIDSILHAIETNPGVRRLAANPLLLRVLALIHKTGARIPQRRIELYRLAADTLIRDWNLAKGIPREALAREADANRLLAELAAWMHENRPAGLATEGDIRRKLCEVIAPLRDKEPDNPDVETEAGDFLGKIRHHTGLFVERAPRRFGFMHLTFEEYFAARWLVARPPQAARRIRSKLHRPRWEEPILLAIAFYGMEFPDAVSELVEEAILGKNLGGPSPYEHILFRDLLFAVRAAGDQDVDSALRNQLASQFIDVCLDTRGKGKYESIERRIKNTIEAVQDSQIGNRILAGFIALLKDPNGNIRSNAASALRNASLSPEAVTVLIALLKDPNGNIRSNAASALIGATLSTEAVRALITLLQEPNKYIRYNAALALSGATLSTEAVRVLLALLQDPDENVRSHAALALSGATNSPEAVPALTALLKDPQETVRYSAALALSGATNSPEAVTALTALLKDPQETVRSGAARALGSATLSPEVVTALIALLKDPNETVRSGAALALSGATNSPEAVTALIALLKDPNETVRYSAAQVLNNASLSPEAISALITLLKDPNEGIRANAAWVLSNATLSPEAISALITLLKDLNEDVRSSAARALSGATNSPEAVTELVALLKDPIAYVRSSAARALSNASLAPEAIIALIALTKDPIADVRSRAAWALSGATNSPEAVTALIALLKDPIAYVRSSAAEALGRAPTSPEGVGALITLLKDPKEDARSSAAEAIHQIVKRSSVDEFPNLPWELIQILELPGLDDFVFYSGESRRVYDLVFDSLNIIAPYPRV